MIRVEEAVTKEDIKRFVKFPFSLYKDNKYWVPPIIADEMETFDKTKNPVFEHMEAYFYLAYNKDEAIVGRIAVVINWSEVNILHKKKVRFGWFDFIDDTSVSEALLAKAFELARERKLENIEGPMGFSNLDKVGILTEGFDVLGTIITWYNHPYYASHLEKLGFVEEKVFRECTFGFDEVNISHLMRTYDIVCKKYQLRSLKFTKVKDVMNYADKMFDLFNESYAKLASFVAITDTEKAFLKKRYRNIIKPEYIKFVVDKHDALVAFGVVLPSYSEALQKAKGKLFPFGFIHLLRAKKYNKDAVFYLIGIHPEYQNKGVTILIFKEFYETFEANGVNKCIITPELEENHAIHNIWKNFNPVITCRRKTFIKHL